MDMSAATPFDLAILASADCFVNSKIKRRKSQRNEVTDVFIVTSSSAENFSSNSSNGSTTSPIPMNIESTRNARAHSVAPSSSIVRTQSVNRLQKSTSELAIKTSSDYWLKVVPSCKIRPRECDEVPEEFRRAGIGLCFGGKAQNF